jgi:hypothetical protein
VSRRDKVRSIAITGVIPLPPTRNRIFSGGGLGSTKSPDGRASRMIAPGATPLTRCSDRKPSGIARTVIAMVLPSRVGGELTEYERQWNLPLIWMPMPMYWPGWWS